MNVTELAVLLDNTEFPICHEAAAMLRQQQAEMDIVIKLLCGEQISDDLMTHWNPLHST